jgi:glyoxylase-like metal-dependent hydrolase (beta-lactamase superfamily II)
VTAADKHDAEKAQRAADYAALDFPIDGFPGPGETIEVAPNIFWLRMPLTASLDHINLWLIEDGEGWAIVDSGFANDATRDLWRGHFKDRMAGRPVTRVIVTHFHPDHSGLAGWLCRERDATLWISRTEWLMHKLLMYDEDGRNWTFQAEFYARHGLDADTAAAMMKRGNAYLRVSVEAPHDFHRLSDDDRFTIGGRTWRVIVGTGHAPEHVALYCDELRVLISGDQILPRVTPNITLPGSQPTTDPLGDYLGSIERYRSLPEDTLVLPSHILPFRGLHKRIDQLARHHAARCADIREALDRPMSAAELMPVVFGGGRELDTFQKGFAMGETLAHLAYLEKRGELAHETGADGVVRFRMDRRG